MMDSINVTYHRDGRGWWAESSTLANWSAAGASIEHIRQLAREGVEFVTGRRARTRSAFWIGEVSGGLKVHPAGSECFDLASPESVREQP